MSRLILCVCFALVCGCQFSHPKQINRRILFADATDGSGIHFTHTNGASGKKYFPEMMGSGAAWLDFDRDGNLDLYLVNGVPLELLNSGKTQGESTPRDALFRNNGDGSFTEVTSRANLNDADYGMGAVAGDYNNDGFEDLYVTNLGLSRLYRNNGNGTFTDVTHHARAGVKGFASSAAFLDYDKDGFLDLYVCRYIRYSLAHDVVCLNPARRKQYCDISAYDADTHVLLHSNGDGTFSVVSRAAGISAKRGRGLALVCSDFDNNGFPDIFVANDRSGNFLWRNNGNGTFSEVGLPVGVHSDESGRAPAGMGADFSDVNGDGRFDLYVSNYQFEPNILYLGDAAGRFHDGTASGNLTDLTTPFLAFGVAFADFNLDGAMDICVANGHVIDDVEEFHADVKFAQTPQLFLNTGTGRFKEVSGSAGPPFRVPHIGRGIALADYDNDGDMDFIMTVNNGKPVLFQNRTSRTGHFLTVQLIGAKANRDGVGSRVEVMTKSKRQITEARSGHSYLSRSDPRLNFGLGKEETVKLLRVRWLSGATQEFRNLRADQFLTIEEAKGIVRSSTGPSS